MRVYVYGRVDSQEHPRKAWGHRRTSGRKRFTTALTRCRKSGDCGEGGVRNGHRRSEYKLPRLRVRWSRYRASRGARTGNSAYVVLLRMLENKRTSEEE
ncbi:hypothetical protein MTO96_042759 [Rhipicephalus appendiculatus]